MFFCTVSTLESENVYEGLYLYSFKMTLSSAQTGLRVPLIFKPLLVAGASHQHQILLRGDGGVWI